MIRDTGAYLDTSIPRSWDDKVTPQVVKSWIEAMAQATTPAILITYKKAA